MLGFIFAGTKEMQIPIKDPPFESVHLLGLSCEEVLCSCEDSLAMMHLPATLGLKQCQDAQWCLTVSRLLSVRIWLCLSQTGRCLGLFFALCWEKEGVGREAECFSNSCRRKSSNSQ